MSQTAESCERTETWINRWLDREISADENAAFTRHLEACAQCGREFRMARGLERLLTSIEAPPAVARKLPSRRSTASMATKPAGCQSDLLAIRRSRATLVMPALPMASLLRAAPTVGSPPV